MFKEFMLFIKYPYTAGVIGIVWLGSAALIAMHDELPLIGIICINMIVSVVIAGFGFRGKNET